MLQNQQIQKMVISRRPRHTKQYLVHPHKPLALLDSRDDETEKTTSGEPIVTSGDPVITSCESVNTSGETAAVSSGAPLLYESPTTSGLSFNDDCPGVNFSLFEEVQIDHADDRELTSRPLVPSSEVKLNRLKDSTVDEAGCDVTDLQSREYLVDKSQHSPPESRINSLKYVAKYFSETPPHNNKLELSQQDIQHLNRRFRHTEQITRTPDASRSRKSSQAIHRLDSTDSSDSEALDLSRPKPNERIPNENVDPEKRQRTSKSRKKYKRVHLQEQSVAIDFSMKSHSIIRNECKRLAARSADDTNLTPVKEEQEDVSVNELFPLQNGVGSNNAYNEMYMRQNGAGSKCELNVSENMSRRATCKVSQLQNNAKRQVLHQKIIHQKNPQKLIKRPKPVLVERAQLVQDQETHRGVENGKAAVVPLLNGKAKTHACSYCGKLFAQRSSVHTHERTHTGVRPYKCEYCGRDFIDCSTYTKHVRLHTGERPYSCDICGRGFTQSGNMLRHKAARHPEIEIISGKKKFKAVAVH